VAESAFQYGGFQFDAFQIVSPVYVSPAFQPDAFQNDAYQTVPYTPAPVPDIPAMFGGGGGGVSKNKTIRFTRPLPSFHEQRLKMDDKAIIDFVVHFTLNHL
jgi:hypothetical protein